MLEIILAVVIASLVAAAGVHYMRPTGTYARQKSCDLTRQTIQMEAGRYHDKVGAWPRSDLRELNDAAYFADGVPSCPVQGGRYALKGSIVECPLHESTRTP